jgi:hypothetical protein
MEKGAGNLVRKETNNIFVARLKQARCAKNTDSGFKIHRGMEQLVARRAHNPKVVGSSPAPATKTRNQK